mmetsp:Transcript_17384/g.54286  ORF Transcript_17384/g.54286 Transcript_17384/m.54286 type:complete len:213 (-) Transcript_17384:248-886(-)
MEQSREFLLGVGLLHEALGLVRRASLAVLLVDLRQHLEAPAVRLVRRDALARGDLRLAVPRARALVHRLHELEHGLLLVARVVVRVARAIDTRLELGVAESFRRPADLVTGLAPVAARVRGRLRAVLLRRKHGHAAGRERVAAAALHLQREPRGHGLLAFLARERLALRAPARLAVVAEEILERVALVVRAERVRRRTDAHRRNDSSESHRS